MQVDVNADDPERADGREVLRGLLATLMASGASADESKLYTDLAIIPIQDRPAEEQLKVLMHAAIYGSRALYSALVCAVMQGEPTLSSDGDEDEIKRKAQLIWTEVVGPTVDKLD